MNPLSINDEVNELSDTQLSAYHQQNESAYIQQHVEQANLNDYVNDHSNMLRGVDGSVHSELRDDTLVTVDGIETTYGNAKMLGMVPDGENNKETDPETEETPSIEGYKDVSVDQQLLAQHTHAENLIGADAFGSALMGDSETITKLAQAAGASEADTLAMIDSTVASYTENAMDYTESRLTKQFNEQHITDYYNSSAVSAAQRQQVLASLRAGNFAAVESLINQYKNHYKL